MSERVDLEIIQSFLDRASARANALAADVVGSADSPPYSALRSKLPSVMNAVDQMARASRAIRMESLADICSSMMDAAMPLAGAAALSDDDAVSLATNLDAICAELHRLKEETAAAIAAQPAPEPGAVSHSEPVPEPEPELVDHAAAEPAAEAPELLVEPHTIEEPAPEPSQSIADEHTLTAEPHAPPAHEPVAAEIDASPVPLGMPAAVEHVAEMPSLSDAALSEDHVEPEQTSNAVNDTAPDIDSPVHSAEPAIDAAPAVDTVDSLAWVRASLQRLTESVSAPVHAFADAAPLDSAHAEAVREETHLERLEPTVRALPTPDADAQAALMAPVALETVLADAPLCAPAETSACEPALADSLLEDDGVLDASPGEPERAEPAASAPAAAEPITQNGAAIEPSIEHPAPDEPREPARSAEPTELATQAERAEPAIPAELAAPLMSDAASAGDMPMELTPEQMQVMLAAEEQAATWGTVPLVLPPEKAELLQFMVSDLKDSVELIGPILAEVSNITARADAAEGLQHVAESMAKTSAFFEFRSLKSLVELLGEVGRGLADIDDSLLPELVVRVRAIQTLIQQHATALEVGMETTWPLDTLVRRVRRLLAGMPLPGPIAGWHKNDVDKVLELDGVVESFEAIPTVAGEELETFAPVPAAANNGNGAGASDSSAASTAATAAAAQSKSTEALRVESAVIDGLLDTIGELVQHKNRLRAIALDLRGNTSRGDRLEQLFNTTDSIDRATADLQIAVMGTRLQSLSKLFDRYPRVVRDVARLSDKLIELTISGGETRVDKAVFDGLAEPLTAIFRYCAGQLVEPPNVRKERSKPETATVRLSAENFGSQVIVTIEDDGKGFDRDSIAADIVGQGLMTAEQAAALSDEELYLLLFDGDLVSSGLSAVGPQIRTVLGGTLRVASESGVGSRIEMRIPMKSAIIPAVMLEVSGSIYTVPLQSVAEIVRLDAHSLQTIHGKPCMRLRDQVIAVVDARRLLNEHSDGRPRAAVIIADGDRRAALAVDRVIGKQDIVIRPLDEADLRRGPFSGATLTDTGRVSLILDAKRIVTAEAQPAVAAAVAATEHKP